MIANCLNSSASVIGLPFTIAGIGTALPTTRVYNKKLADELGVTPDWIETRCGVRARCVAGDQTTAQLGTGCCEGSVSEGGRRGARSFDLCDVHAGQNAVPNGTENRREPRPLGSRGIRSERGVLRRGHWFTNGVLFCSQSNLRSGIFKK
jgi:hypothetical protein